MSSAPNTIEDRKIVGSRFCHERRRLGLNVKQAAEALGVTRQQISRVVRGGNWPGGDFLRRFAELGADINFILTGRRYEGAIEGDSIRLTLPAYELNLITDFIVDSPCRCQPETDRLAGHTCLRCRLLKTLRGKPAAAPEGDA